MIILKISLIILLIKQISHKTVKFLALSGTFVTFLKSCPYQFGGEMKIPIGSTIFCRFLFILNFFKSELLH